MATITSYLKLSTHSTDAEWRATSRAIHDALLAFGWVQTPDTGQIDWTTAARPTAANQVRGSAIYRMNDAAQPTVPVFMKVDYGAGSNGTNWSWVFSFGKGSNGSGLLTGGDARTIVCTQSGGAGGGTPDVNGNYMCLFTGDASRFGMVIGHQANTPNTGGWLVVERCKTSAGADSADGVVAMSSFGTVSVPRAVVLPASGPIPAAEDAGLGCIVPTGGTGVLGANVHIYPVHPFNVAMLNPVRGIAAYFQADLPANQVIAANIYGIAQSWYTVPLLNSPARSGGSQTRALFRFE